MNYNIQNAASKIADPTRTTLEEAFEQGVEWMKYEICDRLLDIKGEMANIIKSVETFDSDELKYNLGNIVSELDKIIN